MKAKNRCIRLLAALLALTLLTASGCRSADGQYSAPEKSQSAAENPPEKSGDDGASGENERSDARSGIDGSLDAAEILSGGLALPEDSRSFSMGFARQALALCSGHTRENEARLLTAAGFEVLSQNNFDKPDDDPGHTCAYTVGRKAVEYNSAERTLVIIAIRGTNGGEWYSNFDFAESHNDDAVFAENFLFAAEDVLFGVQETIRSQRAPLVLVCGHSRGAACANLLAMLLNAELGEENVLAYTFATPNTFRGDNPGADCSNIFNVINSGDLVTKLPLEGWGYYRLGTDITLEGGADTEADANGAAGTLLSVAPSIDAYYNVRRSLTEAGEADDGVTAFELMLVVARALTGLGSGKTDISVASLGDFSAESDFAPLFELLESAGENGGEGFARALAQHLPAKYLELMANCGE